MKRLIKADDEQNLFFVPQTEEEVIEESKKEKERNKIIKINTGFNVNFYEPMFMKADDIDVQDIDNAIESVNLNSIQEKCQNFANDILFGADINFNIQYGNYNNVDLYVSISYNGDFDKNWIRATKSKFQTKFSQWYQEFILCIDEFKENVLKEFDEDKITLVENIPVNKIKKDFKLHQKSIKQYEFDKNYK